jgi:hypothetical protein
MDSKQAKELMSKLTATQWIEVLEELSIHLDDKLRHTTSWPEPNPGNVSATDLHLRNLILSQKGI